MGLDHACLGWARRNTLSHGLAQDLVSPVHGGHAQEAAQGAVFRLGGIFDARPLLRRDPQADGLLGFSAFGHGLTCFVGLS